MAEGNSAATRIVFHQANVIYFFVVDQPLCCMMKIPKYALFKRVNIFFQKHFNIIIDVLISLEQHDCREWVIINITVLPSVASVPSAVVVVPAVAGFSAYQKPCC